MTEYVSEDGTRIILKRNFEEHFRTIFKENFDVFMRYSVSFLRRSIRVNTLKISVGELKRRLEKKNFTLEPIPWCEEGFWVKHDDGRRDLGNLPEHQLGYFYVQEAASMIPPIVLNPKPGELVLDLAASPGSKTTQMAAMMKNKGLIIANDCKAQRLVMLGLNLQRCGVTNTLVTLMDGRNFKDVLFDKILLDAPCSATGALRKSLKTFKTWNPNSVMSLARIQIGLIETAFDLLKENGILVYSTCSVDPEENEAVVSHFLEKHKDADLLEIELNIKRSEPFKKFKDKVFDERISKVLRIHPQDNDTEGFFVAKIIKRNKQ